MNIFNLISLLGGLAMFLYGMRMMGNGLKESSSGPLKQAMEKLTSTPMKAFLLGLVMTAIIQSSTATIVITSGLVGAGLLTLHQSLGIIVGANVGTTVTGQIIRLLDLNQSDGVSILEFFKPSTLAPLALIIGIVMIMGLKFKGSERIGQIMIGFGILFSGLMNMTDAVSSLTESGIVENLFGGLGQNPLIGYLTGAGVAFVLQSSSASIGILQAFSTSGQLTFSGIYPVLVGIYLGDCVTTAIVCNIGAKPDAKKVGTVNIIFNLCKSVLVFTAVTVIHKMGLLDGIWDSTITSGGIANTNSIFNLACALLLFPFLGLLEKLSHKFIKDTDTESEDGKYDDLINSMNPLFYATPHLAFGCCYDVLLQMFHMARENVDRAFSLITNYDTRLLEQIQEDENYIDTLADKTSTYLLQLSGHITSPEHLQIQNHYYKAITEFERLGDQALNIAEIASALHDNDTEFSESAIAELNVLRELIDTVMDYTGEAFRTNTLQSALHIEPLEEVVDDMVNTLHDHHLRRLKDGTCSIFTGTEFLNMLSVIEHVSDICSNVGVATVVKIRPEVKDQVHEYVSRLHSGRDAEFNREYTEAHDRYFRLLGRETEKRQGETS